MKRNYKDTIRQAIYRAILGYNICLAGDGYTGGLFWVKYVPSCEWLYIGTFLTQGVPACILLHTGPFFLNKVYLHVKAIYRDSWDTKCTCL